jgi:hypothetical protein
VRAAVPALVIGLLIALVAPARVPRPEPDITRDLKLVAELKPGTTVEAGTKVWISLALANTSKVFTYPVVKPGDGSEVGWREPYVYFTAERLAADGQWVPAERERYSRCGVCDGDWPKDVVDLKPGERLSLDSPDGAIPPEFQFPGRVRVFGHYAYRASGGKRGEPRPEDQRGRMKGVPLFEVQSEPVEFEVIRPLDVRVRAKRPLKAGVEYRLADVLEVTVTNTTDKPITVLSPTCAADARLVIATREDVWAIASQLKLEFATVYGISRDLQPGETGVLLGGGDLANGASATWNVSAPGTAQLWVAYMTSTWKRGATIRARAEVVVEK